MSRRFVKYESDWIVHQEDWEAMQAAIAVIGGGGAGRDEVGRRLVTSPALREKLISLV